MQAAPYSHSQQPHAVASRPKYRDPAEVENSTLASNLMYDKRVVRGNTYAAQILPATAQAEQLEMERKSQMQKSAKRTKVPPKPDIPIPDIPNARCQRSRLDSLSPTLLFPL